MENETKFSAGSFFLLFSVLSIIACVGFLYKLHQGIVLSPRCIEISAESEKTISADNAIWTISFDRTGTDQSELNKLVLKDRKAVQNFFISHDIQKEDMEFSSFIHEDYRETKKNDKQSYRAGNTLVIKSKDVEKILSLRDNLSELYKEGIILKNNHIDFGCSNNDQVQDQIASEAAIKAYVKAKELTKALHVKVVRIHKIYDPNFQIDGFNNRYLMKSLGVMNSVDAASGNTEDTQPIPKRKIKAIVRMEVEIK